MFMERPAGCSWNGWPDAVECAIIELEREVVVFLTELNQLCGRLMKQFDAEEIA